MFDKVTLPVSVQVNVIICLSCYTEVQAPYVSASVCRSPLLAYDIERVIAKIEYLRSPVHETRGSPLVSDLLISELPVAPPPASVHSTVYMPCFTMEVLNQAPRCGS